MTTVKCGVCAGHGEFLMVMPTVGTSEVVTCSNCGGFGYVWTDGTFAVSFACRDQLPKVRWKGRT